MKKGLILAAIVAGLAIPVAAFLAWRPKPSPVEQFTEARYLSSLQRPGVFKPSYYVPGTGTLDMDRGFPSKPVTIEGEPLPCPVIVLNDLGGYLVRIGINGRVDWVDKIDRIGRGIGLLPGRLFCSSRKSVLVLDPETGSLLAAHTLGGAKIAFATCSEGKLLVGFAESAPGGVRIYADEGGTTPPRLVYTNPHSTNAPRHAETRNGVLYVADSANHRCYAVTMATGAIAWSRASYWPNDIRPLANGRILMVEEHANRITEVDARNESYKILFSCPAPLYRDPDAGLERIRKEEISQTGTTAAGKLMGIASEELSGPGTLYSPNGATPVSDDSYLVADTDNHRVLLIRQGRIVSTLRGFNNPSKIVLLRP